MAASKIKKMQYSQDFPTKADGTVDWQLVKNITKSYFANAGSNFHRAQPNAEELEQLILGAVLVDSDAFIKVQQALCFVEEPFYSTKNNLVYRACISLFKKGEAIDSYLVMSELKKVGKFEEVGIDYILELMNRVASSANVEYHARRIYEQYLRRKSLTLMGEAMQKAYDDTYDIFDVISELGQHFFKLENPNSPITVMNMQEVMIKASKAESQKMLCGSLLRRGDTAFLFAGPGVGKSILSVQIADAISKGNSLLDGVLRNEMGPQKVLYFDFELLFGDYKSRYIDEVGYFYNFDHELYYRAGENENSAVNFGDLHKNAVNILQEKIELIKPEVVIVDNITSIANGATADAQIAMEIMNSLKTLKGKYKLTLLVLAHTPKRDSTKPLTINDMAGSSQLLNFANNIFAIGKSKLSPNARYIKQVKIRNGQETYVEDNVIQCSIEKRGAFLGFYMNEVMFGRESEHLTDFNQEDEGDTMKVASELKKEGLSLRGIIDRLNLKMSHTLLSTKLKKYEAGIYENEFVETHTDAEPEAKSGDDLPF